MMRKMKMQREEWNQIQEMELIFLTTNGYRWLVIFLIVLFVLKFALPYTQGTHDNYCQYYHSSPVLPFSGGNW